MLNFVNPSLEIRSYNYKDANFKNYNEVTKLSHFVINKLEEGVFVKRDVFEIEFKLKKEIKKMEDVDNSFFNKIKYFFVPSLKLKKNLQIEYMKTVYNFIYNKFVLPHKNLLRKFNYNKLLIDKYEKKIIKIEKELNLIRKIKSKKSSEIDDIQAKGRFKGKIAFNLVYYFKKYRMSEIDQINKRFKIQKKITNLEQETKKILGELQENRVQFNESVQVYQSGRKRAKIQALDQVYVERTTKKPKVKQNPKKFIKTRIEIHKQAYVQSKKIIDYKFIKSIVKKEIDELEFSKNPIQKELYIKELDLQINDEFASFLSVPSK